MIRSWLRRGTHRRPAAVSDVEPTVFLGAQFDLRDGQIEGLRDALEEAHRALADERRRSAVLLGELATYKTRDYAAHAARARRRLVEDPTLQTSVEQFQSTRPTSGRRPFDSPTEQHRRSDGSTERWQR